MLGTRQLCRVRRWSLWYALICVGCLQNIARLLRIISNIVFALETQWGWLGSEQGVGSKGIDGDPIRSRTLRCMYRLDIGDGRICYYGIETFTIVKNIMIDFVVLLFVKYCSTWHLRFSAAR